MCHRAALWCDLLYARATGLALKIGQPSLLTLPPSVCPSLCFQVPRVHWWDSAQCCQPLMLKGIIVLSCCSRVNQWDPLFLFHHVGCGARTDVSWLQPAEHRLSRSYVCVSCAFREVLRGPADSHISFQSLQLLKERGKKGPWYHRAAILHLLRGFPCFPAFSLPEPLWMSFPYIGSVVCACMCICVMLMHLHMLCVDVHLYVCVCACVASLQSSIWSRSAPLLDKKIPVWQYTIKIPADVKGPLMSSFSGREQRGVGGVETEMKEEEEKVGGRGRGGGGGRGELFREV